MINSRVNIDYELELFDPNYKEKTSQWMNQGLEFLFLLDPTTDSNLSVLNNYKEEYLKNLERLGFAIPPLTKKQWNKNYWGKLENIPLEQKLNSKLSLYEYYQSLDTPLIYQIVHTIQEIKSLLELFPQKDFILKSPFRFSGQGFLILNKKDTNFEQKLLSFFTKEILLGPLLLEELYKRVLDFSIRALDDTAEFYINKISSTGAYQGSIYFLKYEHFIDYINNTLSTNLNRNFELFSKQIFKTISYYKNLGATDPFVIDSFIFLQNDQFHIHPGCEVNYRKTMTSFFKILPKLFNYKAFEIQFGTLFKTTPTLVLSPDFSPFQLGISEFKN